MRSEVLRRSLPVTASHIRWCIPAGVSVKVDDRRSGRVYLRVGDDGPLWVATADAFDAAIEKGRSAYA